MLMFCISGIVLNHREAVSGVDVSRKWLPSAYRFDRWNHGLLRGSWRCVHTDSMLLYGSNGIWQTDSQATVFADFNEGLLPEQTTATSEPLCKLLTAASLPSLRMRFTALRGSMASGWFARQAGRMAVGPDAGGRHAHRYRAFASLPVGLSVSGFRKTEFESSCRC